jgi:hypothetical protein
MMKISTGLSEIRINANAGKTAGSKKVYLWPNYNAGNVGKIRGVVRRTESNAIYSKPLSDDVDKLFSEHKNSVNQYTEKGYIQKTSLNSYPGMLFEAIA